MYLKKACYLIAFTLILLACNKSDDSSDDTSMEDRGSLTFYHNDPFPCNTISIVITSPSGDDSTGVLSGTAVVSGVPNCDVPNTFTFLNLPYAVYDFAYTCGELTVSGGIAVNSDCATVLMIN